MHKISKKNSQDKKLQNTNLPNVPNRLNLAGDKFSVDGSIESIIYHMRSMQIHISRLIDILKMVKGYLSSTRTRKST